MTYATPERAPGLAKSSRKAHPVALVKSILKLYKLAPLGEGVATPLLVWHAVPANWRLERIRLLEVELVALLKVIVNGTEDAVG